MTVRLSPHKVSKIMRYYFVGMPQVSISERVGVDQSTVSIYASRFKDTVNEIGLLAAGKEYGVMHEVDGLRSLAVELLNNRLTAEEAKAGVAILKLFTGLGVPPAEHKTLVKVVSKLKDPDFVPAAMKLAKLEATTGKSYSALVAQFEHLSSQITKLEQSITALKQENDILRQSTKELTAAKKKREQALRQLEKTARRKQSCLDAEVAEKMKETNTTLARIEKLEPVVKVLDKLGVSDDSLEIYVTKHQKLEELGIGWENFADIVRGLEGDS
ncbi:MAG: hypothetical protein ISS52_00335 [Dehalococcoidia bacterium]|nr:hypothetical protein [Dehalococcoidia bacterium]